MTNRLTIEEMHEIAEKRNGKCLSEKYINSSTKLEWQCEKGHIWWARPNSVKRGDWCPQCGIIKATEKRKDTIETFNNIANMRGGVCLSKKYENSKTKVLFQCREGHQWFAKPSDVKNKNSWCPVCSKKIGGEKRKKYSLSDMQNKALENGGWFLSEEFFGLDHKYWWQCGEGHIWKVAPPNILYNSSWCPYCREGKSGYNLRLTIDAFKKIAENKGGKCLSDEYKSLKSKLLFQCGEGHQWWATAGSIKNQDCWCPICSSNIGEKICRFFFETIFNTKFPKRRPSWLLSDKGTKMELDGYANSLNLAFEFQGKQHYSEDFFKNKNKKKSLKDIQKYDKLKLELCEKNNITLIQVPYTVEISEMKKFIVNECNRKHYSLPSKLPDVKFDGFNKYDNVYFKWIKDYAKSKGGKCLSDYYLGRDEKLKFICSEGHEFFTTPHSLKSMKTWCPTCAGRPEYTIGNMNELAEKRNGKCLSKKYINSSTKLEWQCEKGHIWSSAPTNIVQGKWCPVCGSISAGKLHRLTLKEMQKIAESHNGKFLSEEYINAHTALEWQCEKGHTWWARLANIKNGSWCPICSRKTRKSIGKYSRNFKKFPHKHSF